MKVRAGIGRNPAWMKQELDACVLETLAEPRIHGQLQLARVFEMRVNTYPNYRTDKRLQLARVFEMRGDTSVPMLPRTSLQLARVFEMRVYV